MEIDGIPIEVEAEVSSTLPVSVLLGEDVLELKQLVGSNEVSTGSGAEDVMVVVTRAQAKKTAGRRDCQEGTGGVIWSPANSIGRTSTA